MAPSKQPTDASKTEEYVKMPFEGHRYGGIVDLQSVVGCEENGPIPYPSEPMGRKSRSSFMDGSRGKNRARVKACRSGAGTAEVRSKLRIGGQKRHSQCCT